MNKVVVDGNKFVVKKSEKAIEKASLDSSITQLKNKKKEEITLQVLFEQNNAILALLRKLIE